MVVKSTYKHDINGVNGDGDHNGRNGIVNNSKYARGAGSAGARGGGANGAAENGNGGGEAQGGAAVVPVIIAGAANNNHHPNRRHSAASCNRNCIELPTLIITTLASLTVQLYEVFGPQLWG